MSPFLMFLEALRGIYPGPSAATGCARDAVSTMDRVYQVIFPIALLPHLHSHQWLAVVFRSLKGKPSVDKDLVR